MSEVVFLSNTNIQIATGSSSAGGVKVNKLFSAPLPEGVVLNGVVMDPDALRESIKSIWGTNKIPKSDVILILNSPQLRANRIEAPLQSDKKTTEFIDRATADTEYGRFTKPVTGWYVVSKDSKNKTQKAVYETAESEFVDKYVDIFEKAGLKLKSIHNGVQLATEFFTKQSAGKTLIYMILDGKSLVTIFFAEGQYYYDSTSRVFAQPGTPEFAREIYSSISSIRQFISAQRLNVMLRDVLVAGLSAPQISALSNDILNLDSEIDVSVVTAPSGTSISDGQSAFPFYVYPIAGLRKIDEKLSILKAKDEHAKKSEAGIAKKLMLPAIGIVVLAVLATAGLFAFKKMREAELKEIQDYIFDPDIISQVAEYDAMYDNMAEIGTLQGGADILNEDIESYPFPDSSVNQRIIDASVPYGVDVEIKSYSASSGVFSVIASSPNVEDINRFIGDLMGMEIFESVDYTGYSLSDDGAYWQINVVCTLAGRAPADDAGEVN